MTEGELLGKKKENGKQFLAVEIFVSVKLFL